MKTDLNGSVLSCSLKLFKEPDLELRSKAMRDLANTNELPIPPVDLRFNHLLKLNQLIDGRLTDKIFYCTVTR